MFTESESNKIYRTFLRELLNDIVLNSSKFWSQHYDSQSENYYWYCDYFNLGIFIYNYVDNNGFELLKTMRLIFCRGRSDLIEVKTIPDELRALLHAEGVRGTQMEHYLRQAVKFGIYSGVFDEVHEYELNKSLKNIDVPMVFDDLADVDLKASVVLKSTVV